MHFSKKMKTNPPRRTRQRAKAVLLSASVNDDKHNSGACVHIQYGIASYCTKINCISVIIQIIAMQYDQLHHIALISIALL